MLDAQKPESPPLGAAFCPGDNKFVPTADQRKIVMLAAATGLNHQQIRDLIINPDSQRPIAPDTLTRSFADELANGRAKILVQIASNLIAVATDKDHKGCVTAAIYLTKVWGRYREPEPEWSERKRVEQLEKGIGSKSGWTIIDARPILEEPKPEQLTLAPPEPAAK